PGQLAVGETLAVGQQRWRVAVLLRQLGDDVGKHPGRVLGDRRRHVQGAQRTPETGGVRLQPLDQAHDEPKMTKPMTNSWAASFRAALPSELGFTRVRQY